MYTTITIPMIEWFFDGFSSSVRDVRLPLRRRTERAIFCVSHALTCTHKSYGRNHVFVLPRSHLVHLAIVLDERMFLLKCDEGESYCMVNDEDVIIDDETVKKERLFSSITRKNNIQETLLCFPVRYSFVLIVFII
ncbi:PREDICTED: uncharacterized protein LOC105569106 [Vollenhovia emeryi]|uniref:uncharacterized protein LOC105569106 n=1 Tax=Vollenhovia emeryi TaxID=411798 RepID=UPI0005F3E363|nr:PREDICTED: uncharacterized protein LOC105569106 [Vollenhovia emeryi]